MAHWRGAAVAMVVVVAVNINIYGKSNTPALHSIKAYLSIYLRFDVSFFGYFGHFGSKKKINKNIHGFTRIAHCILLIIKRHFSFGLFIFFLYFQAIFINKNEKKKTAEKYTFYLMY